MKGHALNLVERHCEKVVLGAAGALALYLAWAFLLTSPNTVPFAGQDLSPWQLQQAILKKAQALERSMRDAQVPAVEVPRYRRRLEDLHRGGIFGGADAAGSLLNAGKLRLAVAFGPPLELPEDRATCVRVVAPLAPERPRAFTGRCVAVGTVGEREVGWVRVIARFDRARQQARQLAAGYPPFAARLHVVRVQAQRQELLAGGGFSPWENVTSATPTALDSIPTPTFDDVTGRLLNRAALDAAFREIRASQERLARPESEDVVAGDIPPVPDQKWDAAERDDADDRWTVWVDDSDVQAGRTYRYRVRLWVWNRFVGRAGLVQDAADAAQAVIVGDWSQPSEPLRAAPRTHFFVLGASVDGASANVEVWRWYRGLWLHKLFAVAVGDTIGGVRKVKLPGPDGADQVVREEVDFDTGVVLLDLFEAEEPIRMAEGEAGPTGWIGGSTLVAVCVDSIDGRVEERRARLDRASVLRKRLREK